MANTYDINLTYKLPDKDLDNLMGFNVDGTVNVKISLLNLKDHLMQNISIIDRLIEVSNHITTIVPTGNGLIKAIIDSDETVKELIDAGAICRNSDTHSSNDENYYFSDEETNLDRLRMVNNLVDPDRVEDISSDSNSEDEMDELIKDYGNMYAIINKYVGLLNNIDIDNNHFSEE